MHGRFSDDPKQFLNITCASANVSKLRVVASFLYDSVDKDYDSVKNESVPNSSEIQYSMLETL